MMLARATMIANDDENPLTATFRILGGAAVPPPAAAMRATPTTLRRALAAAAAATGCLLLSRTSRREELRPPESLPATPPPAPASSAASQPFHPSRRPPTAPGLPPPRFCTSCGTALRCKQQPKPSSQAAPLPTHHSPLTTHHPFLPPRLGRERCSAHRAVGRRPWCGCRSARNSAHDFVDPHHGVRQTTIQLEASAHDLWTPPRRPGQTLVSVDDAGGRLEGSPYTAHGVLREAGDERREEMRRSPSCGWGYVQRRPVFL